MRLIIAFIFMACSSAIAHANSPIIVDIQLQNGAVRYSLNKKSLSSDELETWMKNSTARFGASDPVIVRCDGKTPLTGLLDVLLLLKRAGVITVEISCPSDAHDSSLSATRLVFSTDQISFEGTAKFSPFTLPIQTDPSITIQKE